MAEDEEPIDVALDVLRHEMKANERVRELFADYPQQESVDAMVEAFDRVMRSVNDPKKAENVIGIMEMFARQVQSDRLMKAVLEEARDNPMIELEEEGVE